MAPILLAFLLNLFKLVSPDIQAIIVQFIKRYRDALEREAPGWEKDIETIVAQHDSAALTELSNRLREGTQG